MSAWKCKMKSQGVSKFTTNYFMRDISVFAKFTKLNSKPTNSFQDFSGKTTIAASLKRQRHKSLLNMDMPLNGVMTEKNKRWFLCE